MTQSREYDVLLLVDLQSLSQDAQGPCLCYI